MTEKVIIECSDQAFCSKCRKPICTGGIFSTRLIDLCKSKNKHLIPIERVKENLPTNHEAVTGPYERG